MPRYTIKLRVPIVVSVDVEAADPDEAETKALEYIEVNGASGLPVLDEDEAEVTRVEAAE